jgi:glutathione-dependent peroxiredoxin
MRTSREGQKVPAVDLAEVQDGKVRSVSASDLVRGRRVVLFALPGAFTPTCSTAHVPGYVAFLSQFKAAGIADVICLSVNDPYVMRAWQQSEKAHGIHFLADPYAEFTKAMGMDVDHRESLLGTRSWRYSMLIDDGTIEKMFIERDEGDDPFEVSDAETMLAHLHPGKQALGPGSHSGAPRLSSLPARKGSPEAARHCVRGCPFRRGTEHAGRQGGLGSNYGPAGVHRRSTSGRRGPTRGLPRLRLR